MKTQLYTADETVRLVELQAQLWRCSELNATKRILRDINAINTARSTRRDNANDEELERAQSMADGQREEYNHVLVHTPDNWAIGANVREAVKNYTNEFSGYPALMSLPTLPDYDLLLDNSPACDCVLSCFELTFWN